MVAKFGCIPSAIALAGPSLCCRMADYAVPSGSLPGIAPPHPAVALSPELAAAYLRRLGMHQEVCARERLTSYILSCECLSMAAQRAIG